MPLLHGVLNVKVHEACDLPTTARIQAVGCLKRYVCCGALPDLAGSCDPYLCLDVGSTRRLRTRFIQSTHNPVWDEQFELYLADEAEELKVEVKDADVVGADFLGQAVIPVAEVLGGKPWDKWLDLYDATGKQQLYAKHLGENKPSRVHLSMQWTPVESTNDYVSGEVPHTYFPLRGGNRVTLYHDACCAAGPVPGIALAGGGLYSESSCWDDIYDAILKAEKFIWITGWSVWAPTMLKRRPFSSEDSPSLGDLLVKKAEAGVSVLMLVWDDATNNSGLHSGVMATHDQETFNFFKDTEVECVLCPRQGGDEDSYLQKATRSNTFTHHQKTVILDAPMSASASASVRGRAPTKRVLAFVGGLDLTNGRYDDPTHPLFDTLHAGGPHEKDHYQGCVDGWDTTRPCPRQPWHDIHARVEGPTAMDIAFNFMERWFKQGGKLNLHKLSAIEDHDDILLPEALRQFTSKREQAKGAVSGNISFHVETIKSHDGEMELKDLKPGEDWSVQVFRSIDSDSAAGFPQSGQGSYEAGLIVGKGKSVDASIHRAYIHLIRCAKRYLFLENQYFLGSSHLWDSDNDAPCYNQVPAEIALKVCQKIKAREPFRVYILIPMYPEGVPTSGSDQAILYFQTKTRQMMYRRIAAAIREAGLVGKAKPTDYLQFFCVGKREADPELVEPAPDAPVPTVDASGGNGWVPIQNGGNGAAAAPPTAASMIGTSFRQLSKSAGGADTATCQGRACASRRFMIYVHSKLMIVDDEYILLGSANINQRSLDGSRDSEICIGAFQPQHTLGRSATGPLPRGQVAGFRKALWAEHLGGVLPEVDDPSSLECMQELTRIGDTNWQAYLGPVNAPLPHGHLMLYPTRVDTEGYVSALPDCEEVPDLGGKLTGTKSMVLPGVLTT